MTYREAIEIEAQIIELYGNRVTVEISPAYQPLIYAKDFAGNDHYVILKDAESGGYVLEGKFFDDQDALDAVNEYF